MSSESKREATKLSDITPSDCFVLGHVKNHVYEVEWAVVPEIIIIIYIFIILRVFEILMPLQLIIDPKSYGTEKSSSLQHVPYL